MTFEQFIIAPFQDRKRERSSQVKGFEHGVESAIWLQLVQKPHSFLSKREQSAPWRSEEHTSELQSRENIVCRLLLEKKKKKNFGRRNPLWPAPLSAFRFRSSINLPSCFFFFNDTATTEIYTLSLHDALPISRALH